MNDDFGVPLGGGNAAVRSQVRGASSPFQRVLSLFPLSGIQIHEFELPASVLALTYDQYIEHVRTDDAGDGPPLLVLLGADSVSGGVAWHPLTHRALAPDEIIGPTGFQALEPYMATWLPFPYLRYVGRSEDGAIQYDEGPLNWARLYVAAPEGPLRAAGKVKALIAFDTRIVPTSRLELSRYLGPNAEDAILSSTFLPVTDPSRLKGFISERWLDRWLSVAFNAANPKSSDARFKLAHIVHYLTLLRAIGSQAALPAVRFLDRRDGSDPRQSSDIDLIVDIGGSETTAVLVEPDSPRVLSSATPLRLRALSKPQHVHVGRFPTAIEFDQPPFGDVASSRLSGRADAFLWPSPARIGTEAHALSMRANAAEGITGLADLKLYLLETTPSVGVWRRSSESGERLGPMVAGASLHSIRGERLLEDKRAPSSGPPVRPQFSRSELMSFFVAEIVAHALTQINAAVVDVESFAACRLKRIRQVVLTADITMSDEERAHLLARARAGVDLVWRSIDAGQGGSLGVPPPPEVVLGLGVDLGAQFIFLTDEVRSRFNGELLRYLGLMSAPIRIKPYSMAIRIGSLELGERATGLTAIEFRHGESEALKPQVIAVERWGQGRSRVVDAVLSRVVIPSIERAIEAGGLKPAAHFIDEITGRSSASHLIEDPLFARRFNRRVLRPAAEALVTLHLDRSRLFSRARRTIPLSDLTSIGGGRMAPLDDVLDAAARRAGVRGFGANRIGVAFTGTDVGRIVQEAYRDLLERAVDHVRQLDCDLLLVHGAGARSGAVVDLLRELQPVPATRIRVLDDGTRASAISGADRIPPESAELVTIVAAYLASRDMLKSTHFDITTNHLVRQLSFDDTASSLSVQASEPLRSVLASAGNED